MPTMVFINLPVADLDRSKSFYEALGYTINPDFTDETAACIVVSDTVYVMLLTHAKFTEFTDKAIAGPDTIEVINSLSADSKDEVHRIVDAAVMAGGSGGPAGDGPRLHVPAELHRPRRTPVGVRVDGPAGDAGRPATGVTGVRGVRASAAASRMAP